MDDTAGLSIFPDGSFLSGQEAAPSGAVSVTPRSPGERAMQPRADAGLRSESQEQVSMKRTILSRIPTLKTLRGFEYLHALLENYKCLASVFVDLTDLYSSQVVTF